MFENAQFLLGKKVLISCGPMRTAMDSVRFLQNRSSGKMGLEVARAAQAAGAEVTVLLGPIEESCAKSFSAFEITRYSGASEYIDALDNLFPSCDIFLSLAAVLDFEFVTMNGKLERETIQRNPRLEMDLKPVPDIVARMAGRRTKTQRVIAFAAESGTDTEIVQRASRKRERKDVEAIVANPVRPGLGPDAENNELWIIRPDREAVHLGPAPKSELAMPLLASLFT